MRCIGAHQPSGWTSRRIARNTTTVRRSAGRSSIASHKIAISTMRPLAPAIALARSPDGAHASRYRHDKSGCQVQTQLRSRPWMFRAAVGALACVLLAASLAAAQHDSASAVPASKASSGAPWWIVPVLGGGGALIGFGAGASVGLVAYGNACESCWGGGDAWLTAGVIGAGAGAGLGLIASTIIVLTTDPTKSTEATPVIVASPERAYGGVRVAF